MERTLTLTRRVLIVAALLLVPTFASAATFYVDCGAAAGGDGSLATPWDAVADVNGATFSAGDSVLFKKGCVWRETLTVPSSGSAGNVITFGAYGSGAAPVLNGADLIAPGTSWAAASAWSTGVTYTLNTNETGAGHIDYRTEIPANASSTSGTKVRLTFTAHSSSDTVISGVGIGVSTSGANFDSAGTRVTFDNGNSGVTVSAGATKVSDEITFTFTKTNRHLVNIWASSAHSLRYAVVAGPSVYYDWTTNSDQSTTQNFADLDLTVADRVFYVSKIETYDTIANAWQTAVTTEPQVVFFDGTKGTKETGTATLNAAREWYWASNVLYAYAASDPDTLYTAPGVEAGARDNGIYAANKNYVTVDGLSTTGTNSSLIKFEGSVAGNTIRNCESSYNGASSGIILWVTGGTGSNTVDACTIHHTAGDGVTWFDVYSGSGTESYLKNSTIYNTGTFGAYLKANYLVVEHNTVHDVGTSGTANIGIEIQAETDDAGTGQHNIVRYNRVYGVVGDDVDADGIELDHWTTDNQVYYNVVYDNEGHCITVYDSASASVYNNTCYGNLQRPTFSNAPSEIQIRGTASKLTDNLLLKNNVAVATEADVYAIYVDANSYDQTPTITNNAWVASAANWYFWNSTGGDTLSTWNALTGVGTDLNADPLLVSASNFRLQAASPAINAGVDVSLTSDFTGRGVRGLPDIGAYEFAQGGIYRIPSSTPSGATRCFPNPNCTRR